MIFARRVRFSLFVIAGLLLAGGAAVAEEAPYAAAQSSPAPRIAPTALSPADRLTYTTAFDALRRGDLEAARASARQAQDRILLGHVEFERLFHPTHTATYQELSDWLELYADLPEAPRAYALALRRRPDGAAEPRRPAGIGARDWNSVVQAGGGSAADDPAKAARIAYNADDLIGAHAIGAQIGDWWTVGLATWRMNRFDDSFHAFERVAHDPMEDAWVRAGAAYWAARAAAETGRHDRISAFLQLSASWPATFYGQIAQRRLGEEMVIENQGPRPYLASARAPDPQPADLGVDAAELESFVRDDPAARRVVAFHEVGRRQDAQNELRLGLRGAVEDNVRRLWVGLARALDIRRSGQEDARRIDAAGYPLPPLEPEGGFTIERALVYAIARKETDFNPEVRSSAGAYGLMQVMPTTAAEMTGDRSYITDPRRLYQPAVNMRLGQTYVNRMLQMSAFEGDILRAVASYNAGPGPMLGALRKLGPDADPLLLIETLDVPQARDYVEKVVAAYWIYQRLLGGPLNTLDALARGERRVPIGLDYVSPPPAPVEVAAATPVEG